MSTAQHELEESIDRLAEMIDGAKRMTEAGQVVELDILALKIAVLTDALAGQDRDSQRPNPIVAKLERMVAALNQLEVALRKRNVNLELDLQLADRRLRAQLAYGVEKPGT